MIARRLAVIGLGLIGGSVIRALRSAGCVGDIAGYDAEPRRMQWALSNGVIDRCAASAAEAVLTADLVVIAVPVLRTAEAMQALSGGLQPGAVVTDVGSTKQSVLADIERVCGELPAWFVAGHPIAGTEKSGVEHAFPELFRGHRVVLTPHRAQDTAALARVQALWEATGARVVLMDAARHDAIFAATSHLPHVLAFSFVDMLARLETHDDIFPNAGGGFRDFTRIASSSPQMWHDIVRANAEAVSALLGQQIESLQNVQQQVQQGDWDALKKMFERARSAREQYLGQIE